MVTSVKERLISGFSYLTFGLVGFIWLIFSHIRNERMSPFLRFNIFQSIFIAIILYLLGIVFNIILGIVQIVPIIGPITVNIAYYLKDYPMVLGYSPIDFAKLALVFYLAISAFTGRYGEVPWVSDTVRRM